MRQDYGPFMLQGLRDMLAELPHDLVMAEIGVYAGESTRVFVESGQVTRLLAVDPWAGDFVSGDELWRSPFPWDEVQAAFMRLAEEYPQIVVHRMPSLQAAELIADESMDFVYLDGEHSFEAVSADIAAWEPKIKPGGWLGGHDWGSAWPGVQRAVEAHKLPIPRVFQDSSWLVRVWW